MSSLGGAWIAGNRSRNTAMISLVSSTESVVWVRYATFDGSGTSTVRASSGEPTRITRSGACPLVPTTSSWPSWPMSRIVCPSRANRRASRCTFVTSGQVASITDRPREEAFAYTSGATPCADSTTSAPWGTSLSSSTNTAPFRSRSRTTCRLCTICLRTYTGAPRDSRACSTVATARSTPAQYPRGAARMTFRTTPPMVLAGGSRPARRGHSRSNRHTSDLLGRRAAHPRNDDRAPDGPGLLTRPPLPDRAGGAGEPPDGVANLAQRTDDDGRAHDRSAGHGHDPHPRPPLAHPGYHLIGRALHDQHVAAPLFDLRDGLLRRGRAGSELPVGPDGGPLQLGERLPVGREAHDHQRAAHLRSSPAS